MHVKYDKHLFEDIDQFREHFRTAEIEPIQLSAGRIRLGVEALSFEDVVVTRIDCNRKVYDRFHMDPGWLLLVVLLTPQQWDSVVAEFGNLVVVAPGTEYRNSIPEGFRCVEAAIRLDLADEIGLSNLSQLKGVEAVLPISPIAARRAEHRVDRILSASATCGATEIDNEVRQCLRESCLEFLHFLRDAACFDENGSVTSECIIERNRFKLAEAALHAIESVPEDELLSVETLATALNTTRRTLLNAFRGTIGTSPSRYMLARRLNGAQHDLLYGKSPTVTHAALDHGFEHFGRFAHHYRNLFGETPSKTLLRSSLFLETS